MEKVNVSPSRVNNFDLLRILAALQVVLGHSIRHLKIEGSVQTLYEEVLKYFPGVPIFFFVSGFLITWSFDRQPDKLRSFFYKRGLRVFPALWVCCFICALLLLLYFPGKWTDLASTKEFVVWLSGQFTFFQFYTPEVLRFWGVGTPNGSLWTIVVELQFYFILPLLYYLAKRSTLLFLGVMCVSIGTNVYLDTIDQSGTMIKLAMVNVLPYLYYFGVGVLSFFKFSLLKPLVEGKFIYWLLAYGGIVSISVLMGFEVHSYWIKSPFSLLADLSLMMLTLSAAYTVPTLSHNVLKGNDISYGVYIYHMLIINVFVAQGLLANEIYILIVFLLTLIVAYLSWVIIEKPSLKLKKRFSL